MGFLAFFLFCVVLYLLIERARNKPPVTPPEFDGPPPVEPPEDGETGPDR